MQITIDPEFQSLIPPLSPQEYQQLEANLLADGCRDPLVVWGNILIDGHNRYKICQEHNRPFAIVQLEFDGREQAINWIVDNQLGRRNLTPDDMDYLIGKKYNLEKKPLGGASYRAKSVHQIDEPISTAQRIGNQFGVSKSTVERNGDRATAIDDLTDLYGDNIRQNLIHSPIPKRDIQTIAHIAEDEPETARAILDMVMDDIPKTDIQDKIQEATRPHVANNSGNNEWYTPSDYIEAARYVMNGVIDLDPASSEVANQTVQAVTYFTRETNGLDKLWYGNVWLNPPYAGDLIGKFTAKFIQDFESGDIYQGIILVNNATETQWFQALLGQAWAVCFPKQRIRFLDPLGNPSGSPLQGQAVLYFGPNVDLFSQCFTPFGAVLYVH